MERFIKRARRQGRRRARWVALGLAVVAAVVAVAHLPAPEPTAASSWPGGDVVVTEGGRVRGRSEDGVRYFTRIPYAAPPVGDLRWASPQPAAPWAGVLDATQRAPRCAQLPATFAAMYPDGNASDEEDCLYLNVTAPASARPGRPRPVMVVIHGGAWIEGSGGDLDATRMADVGDAVVVTINYRLGVFGFFGHPSLPGSGAYGLEDQQAALRWVRANVGAFGGDAGNVTIVGESAGAHSVCAQLAAPGSAGLFHRAVMQSSGCVRDVPAHHLFPGLGRYPAWSTFDAVAATGRVAAAQLGCGDDAGTVACLRGLPVAHLKAVHRYFGAPATGSPVLPTRPDEAFAAGAFHRVPVIVGATRDENRLVLAFTRAAGQSLTPERYGQLIADAYGADAPRVAAEYPVSDYPSPDDAWARLTTDRMWSCPTQDLAHLFAAHVPTYGFEFADPDPPELVPGLGDESFPLGAYHGSDLPFHFGMPSDPALDRPQRRLSEVMIRYWAEFMRDGDPNGWRLPAWAPFDPDAAAPTVQSLAPGRGGVRPTDAAAGHDCAFWATVAG